MVGRAVLSKILPLSRRVYIVGLRREEVEETLKIFSGSPKSERHPVLGEYLTSGKTMGFWGDIFLSIRLKDVPKGEIESNRTFRLMAVEDLLGLFKGRDRQRQNFLYALLRYLKPDVVVDTVNTATAIAYRNIFKTINEIYGEITKGEGITGERAIEMLESILLELNIPILINHMMNLRKGLEEGNVKFYLKVGTTGTGGMGWNIPYTHGEDKPSRVLLNKSAIAGASTLLYLLINRDEIPTVVKEIKPAAMIGWKRIGKGEIRRGGEPIRLKKPAHVEISTGYVPRVDSEDTGRVLETAFIDTGENGVFSLEEFRAITSLDQMEMVTAEDIADVVLLEIMGKSTGKDVVGALESSILGSSYRGGYMREDALHLLERYQKESDLPSVAFEILGPPRLSKLLFEAHILREVYGTLPNLIAADEREISRRMWETLERDETLLSYITSVGIGVLSPDGRFFYTENLKVPGLPFEIGSEEDVEEWAKKGWVDTRVVNAKRWKNRATVYLDGLHRKSRELRRVQASSHHDRIGLNPKNLRVDERIIPGELVRYIFIHEDRGKRTRPY